MRRMDEDLQIARGLLPPLPPRQPKPAFILLSGLPGTGKTHLSRLLAERLPLVVIRTDEVRKALFAKPTYDPAESYRVYRVCQALIEELLCQGTGVIFDATNLAESSRKDLYAIAERCDAKLMIVKVVAPEDVIRDRLLDRQESPEPWDRSDATWEIYQSMKKSVERIRRPHHVVNTAQDLQETVDQLVCEAMEGAADGESGPGEVRAP